VIHEDAEAYVLGALDDADARAFQDHLPRCAACKAAIDSYAPVLRMLDSVPFPRPAADRPPIAEARRHFAGVRSAVAVLAAALIFGAGLLTGHALTNPYDRDLITIATMWSEASREVHIQQGAISLRAVVGSHGHRTAFILTGLPPPPAGHAYQLWLKKGKVYSPGVFRQSARGIESLIVVGDVLSDVSHVGVSVEAAAGSPIRTTPPVIAANVRFR
jgi:anti-sigma-K factor RskA